MPPRLVVDTVVAALSALGSAGREAIVTMLPALAGTLAMATQPGPAVLTVVLCLSFSRNHLGRLHWQA